MVEVPPHWLKETYGPFILDELIERSKRIDKNDFLSVPKNKKAVMWIQNKVKSVKYVPPITREVIDRKKRERWMEKLEANRIHRELQKSRVEEVQWLDSKGQPVTKDKPGANDDCLLYTSPSPRDQRGSRMPSSA